MSKNNELITQKRFNTISIGLASPEVILGNSRGEVLKPETINYRTHKPERDGLFCERIFGPVKDYECACGKYKRIRYKGIVCHRCGVEVTEKKVRRDRVGHISLVVPVVHIWYFRSLPNKIGYLLGLPSKKLDMVIYYERYVVIQAGNAVDNEGNPLERMQFLTEDEYLDAMERLPIENQYLEDADPNKFIAKMGAEAVQALLGTLDLDELSYQLRHKANTETSQQRKQEALKRLQVVESLRDANSRIENNPEWMVMSVVPVIPPELRPLAPLDGGRFATSDLNDLYRRVIIRNNRLKRLVEIKAPEVILRNEKRMLQESVDSLFDNTRKSSAVKTESNRPLKSLSDSLKGKQGRFRQNLLGKRVDYSARSVIVVGPEFKLHECGLPKNMAAELYKPFIIRKLIERGIVKTVKSAKKIIDKKEPVVWDILENVIKGHPVLLNRAPTLHRLGIQAFQPILIEGKAIQLHPLTCTAFNADFDGDQMAVHVPLSLEAQLEARILMLSTNNILSPSNGKPIIVPSQDMILGIYYLSQEPLTDKPAGYFVDADQIEFALSSDQIKVHNTIISRIETVDENGNKKFEKYTSTAGRFLLANLLPKNSNIKFSLVDRLLPKKVVSEIIDIVFRFCGQKTTVIFCDKLKDLGFKHAFKAGISFGKDDLVIPESKTQLIEDTKGLIADYENQYSDGLITRGEKYNKVVDAWSKCTDKVAGEMMKGISATEKTPEGLKINSVYMMADSGARGSAAQMKQLAGMRGLIAKPSGEIIESPIISNFKEGLTALEYFNSTHGARKG